MSLVVTSQPLQWEQIFKVGPNISEKFVLGRANFRGGGGKLNVTSPLLVVYHSYEFHPFLLSFVSPFFLLPLPLLLPISLVPFLPPTMSS